MGLLEILKEGLEKLCLTNTSETKKMVTLMAVTIFWDKEIDERELVKAKNIVKEHFWNLGCEEEEITYIIVSFKEKIKSYKRDERVFREDRVWLNNLIKEDKYEDRIFLEYAKKILEADGYISGGERDIMLSLVENIQNHKGL